MHMAANSEEVVSALEAPQQAGKVGCQEPHEFGTFGTECHPLYELGAK